MRIALIGASGQAGSRILAELSARGHQVTAIARDPCKIASLPGVTAQAGDAADPATLAPLLAGHDAVVSSIHFSASDPDKLIAAVKQAGVARYLVVGGAGSLEVAPGVKLFDTPDFPSAYLQEARAGGAFLERLKREDGLDWTFLSPSAWFVPGERTGHFRLGTDQLLVDATGDSRISFEDYAIALADEIEQPKHIRRRFTVGY
ncbi:NAD(P)-dependent oxidoreductase [Teichococcus cervicalis]|uniref:NAD dependent epimerase/dehydratase family protein n=1 Tax=Pseudoroseomonas cervicalis ATCC 49957 TaxID=525371 RepID=D5RHD8_9PROT|nr:NAD(P)-dependent oxidoreductase [Pseudoroseomonas cervicalis]EFH13278.1 NAD dependent epimerase/dehydratase family protein [Pseudoroseomonas cervicalis ATCC 49957]